MAGVVVGFFVLGLLAYRTYQAQPPVPGRVVDANGDVLFTGKDISRGQRVFSSPDERCFRTWRMAHGRAELGCCLDRRA
jgi:nitric oxide reductase large subunit